MHEQGKSRANQPGVLVFRVCIRNRELVGWVKCVSANSHSSRKLSTGSSFAARVAGTVPNRIPTRDETTIATIAESPDTGKRYSVRNRTEKGIASQMTTPIKPPPTEIRIASDKN